MVRTTIVIPMASQTLLYDTNGVQEHQESIDERVLVTTEKGLSGNLLGLKPSKPYKKMMKTLMLKPCKSP